MLSPPTTSVARHRACLIACSLAILFCTLYGIASTQKDSLIYLFETSNTKFEPKSAISSAISTPFSVGRAMFSVNSTVMTTFPEVVVKYRILDATNTVLPLEKMLNLFSDPLSGIHTFFNSVLRDHVNHYNKAFFFECPAVSASTLQRDFEFVLVPSKALETAKADSMAFREHLLKGDDYNDIVAFPNIGCDATLVVPCSRVLLSSGINDSQLSPSPDSNADSGSGYAHLASFTMSAPPDQANRLWQRVFEELRVKLAQNECEKVWLSTSGLGVPWLHIRLDSVPKYYHWKAYRET